MYKLYNISHTIIPALSAAGDGVSTDTDLEVEGTGVPVPAPATLGEANWEDVGVEIIDCEAGCGDGTSADEVVDRCLLGLLVSTLRLESVAAESVLSAPLGFHPHQ
jgi:hypothetical protein